MTTRHWTLPSRDIADEIFRHCWRFVIANRPFDYCSFWIAHLPFTNQFGGENGEFSWILLVINFNCMSQVALHRKDIGTSYGFSPAASARLGLWAWSMQILEVNKDDDGRGCPYDQAIRYRNNILQTLACKILIGQDGSHCVTVDRGVWSRRTYLTPPRYLKHSRPGSNLAARKHFGPNIGSRTRNYPSAWKLSNHWLQINCPMIMMRDASYCQVTFNIICGLEVRCHANRNFESTRG